MYKDFLKRLFDLILAFIAFLVLSPIFIFVTIGLLTVNKGKPFFFQERPGKNEKVFKVIKFKTMTDERDNQGKLLPDNLRLTRIGSIVRKLSLDEIPQLINVIKGDMSLIGPRPLRVHYLPLYSDEQRKRHDVRPGITGWAQVNGRNTISWQKKFEYDLWYVNNMSLKIDLNILILTVMKVFTREGISQDGQTTVEPFIGKN
jgi:lipopolysaccharide/colanic/teichoic acid biosynthesis glycosyltransferase